ncbi:MAG: hypothetical protein IT236_07270, partial [Bacteroidia bacterium]|nr:hypothetical protein [Bacteroidia bacterium]
ITNLKPVEGNGYFTNYVNKTSTKPFLIVYPPHMAASAASYKAYRESAEGGSYNVTIADASKLYEQFIYGANKHPLGIKNFIRLLNDSLPVPPKYVLLLGHGVHPHELLNGTAFNQNNLMPGIGSPASDQHYTSALSDTNIYVPQIPIGRLAVYNNSQVTDYLNKIKEHERVADTAAWKKKVLHFVGGDDQNLVNTISSYMDIYKGLIEDTLFGGTVTSFKKNTTAPIQTNINDSVFRIINNGSSLLTFFGHGHAYGFDQAIDNLNKYTNKGRYPFLIANSCNSGDLYLFDRPSISETFVLTPNKGSLAFIAPTSFGLDQNMFLFTKELYKAIATTRYAQGLGDAIKEAIFQNNNQGVYQKVVSMDMAFHGDPSLSYAMGLKPDFVLQNKDLSFDLKKYTDSLGLEIKYKNNGAARSGKLSIKILRYFPNGDSSTVFLQRDAARYRDTLRLYLPVDFTKGFGLNRFTVKVDYFNQFTEWNEDNNATIGTVDLFIPGGDIYPVYPYYYAVVPKTSSLVLKASTSDPFAPLTRYRLQLDTCDKFIAPIQSTVISSKGGVIEWKVNLPFADSTVYFWRVSRDSVDTQLSFVWRESSFQTINTKRGWGQAHFDQFKSDKYQFVKYQKSLRKYAFSNSTQIISCRDALHPSHPLEIINYYFNSIRLCEFPCAFNGWVVAVFDSISGEPKKVLGSSVNPYISPLDSMCHCKESQAYYNFGFSAQCGNMPTWRKHLETFLGTIPQNDYVLAFVCTVGNYNNGYSTFPNSLYNAFESIGARRIRTLPDTVPYILFGRKGMTRGQGHEVIGMRKDALITLEDSIKTRWRSGYVASEKIGPSYKWNSLHWRVKSLESGKGDSTVLKVVGFNKNGGADTLATFPADSTDVLNLADYADAAQYPFLQLVAFMQDKVYTTAPQLQRWQVLYDEAPECAINPLKGFASINDSLQEGDVVTFRFPIENIGVKNMEDSLVTTYWIDDNQHNKVLLKDKLRKGPFVPGQIIIDTVKVNSYQLLGNNALWIHVNPINNKNYQHEQFQLNNVGRYAFKVRGDVTNPLLDVTFDGVRILNGDLVSARPNILITLKDENKFLALNDTSDFNVYLQSPGQSAQQRIYFGQGLVFTPADLPKNSCSILYNPLLLVDGRYTLVVQAKDRSSNLSGYQDYRVQFEVNNQPSITGVLNYPNPFSTSTKFVFTLTGSEIPEVFTIQIMTISGKIVREITREELGH